MWAAAHTQSIQGFGQWAGQRKCSTWLQQLPVPSLWVRGGHGATSSSTVQRRAAGWQLLADTVSPKPGRGRLLRAHELAHHTCSGYKSEYTHSNKGTSRVTHSPCVGSAPTAYPRATSRMLCVSTQQWQSADTPILIHNKQSSACRLLLYILPIVAKVGRQLQHTCVARRSTPSNTTTIDANHGVNENRGNTCLIPGTQHAVPACSTAPTNYVYMLLHCPQDCTAAQLPSHCMQAASRLCQHHNRLCIQTAALHNMPAAAPAVITTRKRSTHRQGPQYQHQTAPTNRDKGHCRPGSK